MAESKTSFYKYASKYATHIPIIQRDYAQGREGENEKAVLSRFLNDLSGSLENDKPLSLNFIYGIEESNNIFLPIDGQQRLTTLFLLHWFVALRTRKLDVFLKNIKLFTYQTRSSAIDFFASIQPSLDDDDGQDRINELYLIQSGNDIKNFPWFKIDWFYDQTVVGVINALNRMFELFSLKDLNNWWKKLISEDKCSITFLFIAINKIGNDSDNPQENEARAALTYIKMNARGKHLSNFENAKALIHSLNEYGENFAIEFDSEYIKAIEIIASKPEKIKDIGKISRIVDDMMMQLMINLFNDFQFLIDDPALCDYTANNYLSYMDRLRDFQENPDNNKTNFFKHYFDILDMIFKSEIINTEEFYKYVSDDNRPDRLNFCLLFSYFCHNGYNVQYINELKYLLNNFHYKDRDNTRTIENYVKTITSLYSFSRDIKEAGVSGSPIFYVSQKPEYHTLDKIPSVKEGDWKEEHIKSKILSEYQLNFDYFNIIEDNFNRRIRSFLYMAGFWTESGDKALLDSYIVLSIALELKFDYELPLVLKKLYYLLATGFDGTTKSDYKPNIDLSLFNWIEPDDTAKEKLNILSSVYNYLIEHSLNSLELIERKIKELAQYLYNDCDWRSFALSRNKNELFFHLDGDKLHKSDDEILNVFEYVKQLDVGGKSIKETIHYQCKNNLGAIGTNTSSKYTITYEYMFFINIKLSGINDSGYNFYVNINNLFQVYRYIGDKKGGHQFEVLEFDITKDLENYISLTRKIKEKFTDLSAEIKTKPIYSKDYSELKRYCKDICGEICEIEVMSYYNTIITKFDINIIVDLSSKDIIRKTELLCL